MQPSTYYKYRSIKWKRKKYAVENLTSEKACQDMFHGLQEAILGTDPESRI